MQEQEQQQRINSSPQWYRNIAITFFMITAILTWAAFTKHDWVYGAFAIITGLNAIMTTLKFITVRETGR
jgi:Na+/melibiose symporter-like transporter